MIKRDLTEEGIIEQRKVREKMMEDTDLDLFNNFKEIVFLSEDDVVTINQVADYYGVDTEAIKSVIRRHRDELEKDGVKVLKNDSVKELKNIIKGKGQVDTNLNQLYNNTIKYSRHITVFSRRAVLRVGMLLRDSKVAKKIRNYLLNIERVASSKTREWMVLREASKIVRKDFTSDIARSGEQNRMCGDGYAHYTNLVYRLMYNETAKELKEEWDVESIRDNMDDDELEEMRRIERTIGGWLNANFEYNEIKTMANKIF